MNRRQSPGLQVIPISSNRAATLLQKHSPSLTTEEVGQCFVTLSLICDLYAFIQQVPLFEPGYQKLSIGLGKTKVSDQIVEVFLVREVSPSLLNCICENVIWISNIFLADPSLGE